MHIMKGWKSSEKGQWGGRRKGKELQGGGIASMDTRGVWQMGCTGSDERFGLLGVWVWNWLCETQRLVKDKSCFVYMYYLLSDPLWTLSQSMLSSILFAECPIICLDQFWHKARAPSTFTDWCVGRISFSITEKLLTDSWGVLPIFIAVSPYLWIYCYVFINYTIDGYLVSFS